MKIFKKVSIVYFALALLFFNFSAAFAATPPLEEEIIFSAEPITDAEELYERVRKE